MTNTATPPSPGSDSDGPSKEQLVFNHFEATMQSLHGLTQIVKGARQFVANFDRCLAYSYEENTTATAQVIKNVFPSKFIAEMNALENSMTELYEHSVRKLLQTVVEELHELLDWKKDVDDEDYFERIHSFYATVCLVLEISAAIKTMEFNLAVNVPAEIAGTSKPVYGPGKFQHSETLRACRRLYNALEKEFHLVTGVEFDAKLPTYESASDEEKQKCFENFRKAFHEKFDRKQSIIADVMENIVSAV